MTTARRLHHTYAEYLEVERDNPVRHEFCDGEIFAMAGGTPEHGALAARMTVLLSNRLPERCRVFSSDVKVRVARSDLTTYPDVSVVCGAVERAGEDPNALTNPALLVEITSPSTEDYDRGEKLSHYKQLPSLNAVLIVSHRSRQVTVHERTEQGWRQHEVRGGEQVHLTAPTPAIELELELDDIYRALDGWEP